MLKLRKAILAIFAAGLLATVSVAQAVPVFYNLIFEVKTISSQPIPVDQQVAIGDRFFGAFAVDSAILASDGLNKAGDVGSFVLPWVGVSWCYNVVCPNNALYGFRGPGGIGSSPGFDVVNGEIVNLRGGMLNSGDLQFIDFSYDSTIPLWPTPGACTGNYCGNSPGHFHTKISIDSYFGEAAFDGTMIVARIPEPSTFGLLGIGLMGLGLASRKQAARYS